MKQSITLSCYFCVAVIIVSHRCSFTINYNPQTHLFLLPSAVPKFSLGCHRFGQFKLHIIAVPRVSSENSCELPPQHMLPLTAIVKRQCPQEFFPLALCSLGKVGTKACSLYKAGNRCNFPYCARLSAVGT